MTTFMITLKKSQRSKAFKLDRTGQSIGEVGIVSASGVLSGGSDRTSDQEHKQRGSCPSFLCLFSYVFQRVKDFQTNHHLLSRPLYFGPLTLA